MRPHLHVTSRSIRLVALVVSAALSLAAPLKACGQGTVAGRILRQNGTAIAGALVEASADSVTWPRSVTTAPDGRFSFATSGTLFLRVSAQGFRTSHHRVDVPRDADARINITLRPSGMLTVTSPAVEVRLPKSRFFNFHEPNYFIGGFAGRTGEPQNYQEQIKFLVAVRYRLLGRSADESGLYAYFQQRSFWNLWEESAPFWDNNYNPGVLLYWDGADVGRLWDRLGLGLVLFEHESNGRDSLSSRSWNRVGGRIDIGNEDSDPLVARIKGWLIVSLDEDHNSDLADYAGRGEVVLEWRLRRDEKGHRSLGDLGVMLKARVGGSSVVRSTELNAFWKPSALPLNSSLMLQWFHGRAEALLDYRNHHNVMRIGLAMVR